MYHLPLLVDSQHHRLYLSINLTFCIHLLHHISNALIVSSSFYKSVYVSAEYNAIGRTYNVVYYLQYHFLDEMFIFFDNRMFCLSKNAIFAIPFLFPISVLYLASSVTVWVKYRKGLVSVLRHNHSLKFLCILVFAINIFFLFCLHWFSFLFFFFCTILIVLPFIEAFSLAL